MLQIEIVAGAVSHSVGPTFYFFSINGIEVGSIYHSIEHGKAYNVYAISKGSSIIRPAKPAKLECESIKDGASFIAKMSAIFLLRLCNVESVRVRVSGLEVDMEILAERFAAEGKRGVQFSKKENVKDDKPSGTVPSVGISM